MSYMSWLHTRGACGRVVLSVVTFAGAGGCAISLPRFAESGWIAGYDESERMVLQNDAALLIHYQRSATDPLDASRAALSDPAVKSRTAGYVRCSLVQSDEADRRYVAQFGIQRAPALILVRKDGTYHAHNGPMDAEQILTFLNGAAEVGLRPKLDPHILREPRYLWYESLEQADRVAQRLQRPILVVFDRKLSRDWRPLEKLLKRREVFRRFAHLVHCKPGSLWRSPEADLRRFAITDLPALVIILTDGSYAKMELPTSYEAIVRFADRTLGHPGGREANVSTGR